MKPALFYALLVAGLVLVILALVFVTVAFFTPLSGGQPVILPS